MRIFWLAISILALVVAVLAWRSAKSGDGSRPDTANLVAMQSDRPDGAAANRTVRSPSDSFDGTTNTTAAQGNALRDPAAAPLNADAKQLADDLMKSSERAGSTREELDDALGEGDDDEPMLPGNYEEDEEGFGEDHGGAGAAIPAGGPAVIDGKYIVAGEGTVEAPFEITWDLLILASQTYQPRQGRTDIPPQVAAVNGKKIRIAGYFAIPIASTDPKEVLFMLNMWDGCCIGVPPSPYDAIEVRLTEPLDGGKPFVNYATLTGTLSVDPFVQNGWLLGMYVMSDGELDFGM